MKTLFKCILLIFLVALPIRVMAISSKLKPAYLPLDAEKIASGFGWNVYKENTESVEFYMACRIYIEKAGTGERYLLIESKGNNQTGTKISIKSRNKYAYGLSNYYGEKSEASYEYGYIEAIDYAVVIAANKILLSGVPDARNFYNYVIDLDTYTAVHIEAYDELNQVINFGGNKYLEFRTPIYTQQGREEKNVIFDLAGNRIKSLRKVSVSSSNRNKLVFYVWGKGDFCHSSQASLTGHAFLYIPTVGYIGFSSTGDWLGGPGKIYDHRHSRECATDSCSVAIDGDQLTRVINKLRYLQQNTPKYYIGHYDCTSFVMDMADAAGINYGNRLTIQTPVGFLSELKKHQR